MYFMCFDQTFNGSGVAVELHTGQKVNLNLTYKSNMLWKISVDFWSGHRTHTQLMIGGCRTGRDLICTHIFNIFIQCIQRPVKYLWSAYYHLKILIYDG